MASGGFVEEMMREQSLLEATCGDLFDHIDDLLHFPKEDSAADVLLLDAPAPGSPLSARIIDVGMCRGNASPRGPSPPAMEPLMALPPPATDDVFFDAAAGAQVFDAKDGGHIGSCDELDMDMAQLEWLSGLFDDASIPNEPAFPGANCAAPIKSSALAANAGVAMLPDKLEDALFRSSSPISVLEHNSFNANNNVGSASSSSSSASSSSESSSGSGGHAWSVPVSPRPEPPVLLIPARARSKRSRPSAFTGGRAVETPTILVPTPMYSSTSSHSDPESIAESNSQTAPPMKKKKARKLAPPAPAASDADADNDGDADYEEGGGSALPQGAVRRCTHCQIEKTPQWRAGPLGPKTLCNACGVRYKSGRLFPEYRPAASPTFVPSIHSNSHKKVVEMRQKAVRTGDPSCDLLQFIRRRD
ncbi:GATA transcription factor 8-like [Phragmites australis]|uniref:GATA transcription factor 8-like n=1 Tax=Phragmites australis TaxID=29695 RepID=UPI002D76655F|nr:GATA transcription factor 8-like [Phragmites australis]XP_062221633.1 GATA transcription factor 8-like [Phragmites australis]XP_062221634.1 GATA transcription factor 8-like [Phragmites australis]XP_062221635.1 GATA transcription factor 8-like [Phragmites australis]